MKRLFFSLIIGTVLTLLVVSAYFGFAKFLKDRETALGFHQPRRYSANGLNQGTASGNFPKGSARNGEGKLPPGVPIPTQPNDAGQAAAQRSLRTLEEINRINEMNRRLMDEQQRSQRR